MKYAVAALIALPFLAGASFAEALERPAFVPFESPSRIDTSHVHRAEPGAIILGETHLTRAEAEDVDINGDGQISFAELMLFELKSDF